MTVKTSSRRIDPAFYLLAVIALGCVALAIGGVTGGVLHWSPVACQVAGAPAMLGMYAVFGRSLRRPSLH